jgi:hypothetical protein
MCYYRVKIGKREIRNGSTWKVLMYHTLGLRGLWKILDTASKTNG